MDSPITYCKLCPISENGIGSKVVDYENQLCRKHHVEHKYEEWLDNTDPENLGIVKWITELMPEFAFSGVPQFHKELYFDLLNLYNPEYVNKYERLYEFICFREGAKSTAANTLFVTYVTANNGKRIKIKVNGEVKYFTLKEETIVIISETAGSAEEFTVRIRDAFSTNERLRYYYNMEITEAIDTVSNQWTRSAFKINNCFIQGVGSGQQIRGKVKGVSRPTLVIADDIYSEKSVLTEESRSKTKSWWNNAVMNSIDNIKGKVIMLGTILHDDTVLIEAKKNPQWQTKQVPLMDLEMFHEFIENYLNVDLDKSTCKLPYSDVENRNERMFKQKQHFQAIEKLKDWKLSWPERIDLYFVAVKYQEAVYNRTTSGMYQEYFHITKAPHDITFRREFFMHIKNWDVTFQDGHTWLMTDLTGKWEVCQIHFGVDLSGTGPDDTVITVIATTVSGKIYVLQQTIGKFALRDDLIGDTGADVRFNKVILDRSRLRKIGIVDEVFRMAVRFHPWRIKIGVAGEEEQVVELARQVFRQNFNYTYIQSRQQQGNEGKKEERIMHTMSPYYETRMVYHAPKLNTLEYQLESLGSSDHDDAADSAECAFYGITYPQFLEFRGDNGPSEPVTDEQIEENKYIKIVDEDWWVTA